MPGGFTHNKIALRYLNPGRAGTFVWQIEAPRGLEGEVRVSVTASNATPTESGARLTDRRD